MGETGAVSEVVSLDDFVDTMRGGCDTPGCTHDHGVMHLRSRCHPKAGASVSLDSSTLILRIACKQCDADIVNLDLAEEEDPARAVETRDFASDASSLPPDRRIALFREGHRVAEVMRQAYQAQDTAMRLAIGPVDPNSELGIESLAYLVAGFVRAGIDSMPGIDLTGSLHAMVDPGAQMLRPEHRERFVEREGPRDRRNAEGHDDHGARGALEACGKAVVSAARRRPAVQIGNGNTMHVHVRDGNATMCSLCGSLETAGGMGMRDRRFSIAYCKKHKAAAQRLWDFYTGLREPTP